jgi:hypothetical protein
MSKLVTPDTKPLNLFQDYSEHNLSVFPVSIRAGTISPPSGHQKYGNNTPSKADIEAWEKTIDLFGTPA